MKTYSVNEMGKLTGVPIETIRSYEALGLIPRALGSKNHRAYAQDVAPLIHFIRAMMLVGFPAEEISALLALQDTAKEDSESRRHVVERHLESAERKMKLLRSLRTALEALAESGPGPVRKRENQNLSAVLSKLGLL